MKKVKLCKDCKNALASFTVENKYRWTCKKVLLRYDLVAGNHCYAECSDERSEEGDCGREGKNWEPI